MTLQPDYIYTAHYNPMEGDDTSRFLKESFEFVHELETAVIRVLRECREPLTLKEIILDVYDAYKLWPEESKWDLAYPITGHLDMLVSRGLIKATLKNGLPAWIIV